MPDLEKKKTQVFRTESQFNTKRFSDMDGTQGGSWDSCNVFIDHVTGYKS